MSVSPWVWLATFGMLIAVVGVDLFVVDTRPHKFGVKEASRWVIFYVAAAIVFGIGLGIIQGPKYASQFFAGYVTEYSLSVDNLFVFVILISSFAVPVQLQHRVLALGIMIALVLRTGLIFVGAAAIARFVGVFYIFGAFLLWTGWTVWHSGNETEKEPAAQELDDNGEPVPPGNAIVRFVERRFNSTREYHGSKMLVHENGKWLITPMLLVIVAIGSTDVLFALDSIPAVFGLTQEAYIVFAVNAFALMGLRQLFFLLHGLLDRLVYLSKGLAFIMVFIGVKLILEAVSGTTDLHVPEIDALVSLAVIVIILVVTTVSSLIAVRRHPELAIKLPDTDDGD
ncbi:MAG: TerC/Alx family metal homeostasis membrane protein [Actinomycetes bacterium]